MGWTGVGGSIPMTDGGPANPSTYQPNVKYVLLLGLMCALPAVTSDIYLPSLPEVARDQHFVAIAVLPGLGMAVLMSYVIGSPFVLREGYGLSANQFALLFAMNGVG